MATLSWLGDANLDVPRGRRSALAQEFEEFGSEEFGVRFSTAVTPATNAVTFGHTYSKANQRSGQTATDNSWWYYPASIASTVSYTANTLNQYSAVGPVTPTYDGKGNLTFDGTFAYGYDAENRLTSVTQGSTGIATYAYDAQGAPPRVSEQRISLTRIGKSGYSGNTNSEVAPGRETAPGFFMLRRRKAESPLIALLSTRESGPALPPPGPCGSCSFPDIYRGGFKVRP